MKDPILLITPEVEVGLNIGDPEKPVRMRHWVNHLNNKEGIDVYIAVPIEPRYDAPRVAPNFRTAVDDIAAAPVSISMPGA